MRMWLTWSWRSHSLRVRSQDPHTRGDPQIEIFAATPAAALGIAGQLWAAPSMWVLNESAVRIVWTGFPTSVYYEGWGVGREHDLVDAMLAPIDLMVLLREVGDSPADALGREELYVQVVPLVQEDEA